MIGKQRAKNYANQGWKCPERCEKHWKNLVKRKNFGARRKRVRLKCECHKEKKQFTRHLILYLPITIHISHLLIQPITLPLNCTWSSVILLSLPYTVVCSSPCKPAWFSGYMPPPTSSFVSSPGPMGASTLLSSRSHISLFFHFSRSSTSSHWLKAYFRYMIPLPLKLS